MKKFLLSIFAVMLAVFSVQAQSYVKVTSAPADWSGDYLIVYEAGNVAFDGSLTTLDAASNTITVAISNGEIKATDATDKAKFTIAKSGTAYTIKSASGYYIGNNSNSNALTSSTGTSYSNTITLNNDGTAHIVGEGTSVLRYNANSGNYRFRYYKSSSYTNQKAIALYKYTENAGGGEGGGEETPVAPDAPTLPATQSFENSMTVEITGIAADATVYYTTDESDPATSDTRVEYTEPFEITATTTVKAIAVNEGGSSGVVSATYTKNEPVTPPAEGEVVDVLTRTTTGITGTTYTDWNNKTATSSAVYAGNSAGGNSSIQLRATNPSGIVTTKSGGKAKKIVVEWNSATATTSGRTLDVYGKNSAYSAATDLYNTSTRGTKLGSIVFGTSTELVIDGDYEYIGLRSNSGAMYLTSISISWDASNVVVVPDAPMLPTSGDFVTSKNIEITNFNDYEDGTTVYYSINGGEPMVYTAAFDITTTCEIDAYAEKDGKKSAEVRAEYTRIAKDPVINIVGDTNADAFEGSIEVEIETENGAVAYYTLNGEEPTVGSTEYEGALIIKATATLKVIAVEEGEYRSKNVVDKTFTMALKDTSVDTDAPSATFDATAQGYVDKEEVASANITDGISVLFDKGTNSNTTKYYENGEAIRSYGGSYFIVKSTVGTIIKIVLTYGSGDGSNAITTDCGEFNSDTWVGNAESVKFTISGTSGNRRIQKITVTYGEPKNENYSLIVTSAGWATLFLDYAVAIPEGVTCYTVSAVSAESATLVNVEDVLPANTAVIVEAEEGEYVFEVTDASTEVESNMLGTTVNKYIFEDAYVLGVVDGVVGLYKAEMAGGAWLNNANKAYLPASAVPNKSAAFYGFDWNGTTGVEKVEIRNEKSEIYDLTGRRVETITEPGIYIVNGKKVLVK